MYIYGSATIGENGRVDLTGFFPEGKEMPKKVNVSIDTELKMITVEKRGIFNENAFATVLELDEDNCICLPEWIVEYLKENRQLLFINRDGAQYLSPKTDSILQKSAEL